MASTENIRSSSESLSTSTDALSVPALQHGRCFKAPHKYVGDATSTRSKTCVFVSSTLVWAKSWNSSLGTTIDYRIDPVSSMKSPLKEPSESDICSSTKQKDLQQKNDHLATAPRELTSPAMLDTRCDLPNHIQSTLASLRANDIFRTAEILEVAAERRLSEVIGILETEQFIAVLPSSKNLHLESAGNCVIFSRMSVMRFAMKSENFQLQLQSIVGKVLPVEAVHSDSTLDVVLNLMIHSGQEDVIVTDDGVIKGTVTIDHILARIRPAELPARLYPGSSARKKSLRSQEDTSAYQGPLHFSQAAPQPHFETDSEEIEINTKEESRAKRYARDHFSKQQLTAQEFCTSWCGELLIAFCVILDISMGIADFVTDGKMGNDPRSLIAMCCIVAIYLYERAMRTYGFGLEIFQHPFWMIDCAIVDISAILCILLLADALADGSSSTVTMMRVLRMLRVLLIVRNLNLTTKIRQAVSSDRTRFKEGGFNLDLTYVNKLCIAMSLPAVGAEASYRNPITEVQRFFAAYHRDRFLIFNLCSERVYSPDKFDGRVVRMDVEDHNPPRLTQMVEFLDIAGQFMEQDPLHCIAVHCLGGKGRTGTMICAWLLYTGFSDTAEEAMEWFSSNRTGAGAKAMQGVTQPSQRRYVEYIERVVAEGGYYTPWVTLTKLVMKTCPHVDADGGCNPWFTIEQNGKLVYDHRQHQPKYLQVHKDDAEVTFDLAVRLEGDVRVIFYDHDDAYDSQELCGLRTRRCPAADDLCFFFWLHTGFLPAAAAAGGGESILHLSKSDVDIACHDHRCKVFPTDFAIELHFDRGGTGGGGGGGGGGGAHDGGGERNNGTLWTIPQPSGELLSRTRAMKVLSHFFLPTASRRASIERESRCGDLKLEGSPSFRHPSPERISATTSAPSAVGRESRRPSVLYPGPVPERAGTAQLVGGGDDRRSLRYSLPGPNSSSSSRGRDPQSPEERYKGRRSSRRPSSPGRGRRSSVGR